MRASKFNGIHRRVVITVESEERSGEVRLYREGRLGLANRSSDVPLSTPFGPRKAMRSEGRIVAGKVPSQSKGGWYERRAIQREMDSI